MFSDREVDLGPEAEPFAVEYTQSCNFCDWDGRATKVAERERQLFSNSVVVLYTNSF